VFEDLALAAFQDTSYALFGMNIVGLLAAHTKDSIARKSTEIVIFNKKWLQFRGRIYFRTLAPVLAFSSPVSAFS
jgi:hypothetical protein